jgi:hypothetical protein
MGKIPPNQLHPYAERVLQQIILKDLTNKGRPDWDRPHTEAVVYWMKYLLEKIDNPALNRKVLITAAYAHDWGYANLFPRGERVTVENVLPHKEHHMKRSAEMIERLLYQRLSSYYTEAEILRVVHLVSVHDKVRELKDEDELLLMETDTLGMIDEERSPATMGTAERDRFLKNSIYNLRLPRFMHSEAKKVAQELLSKRLGN